MSDFYAPFLKTERAKHHIDQLEAIFRDYTRRNTQRLRRQNKKSLLKSRRTPKNVTFPKHTSTVLGDAIHNLRASLDHAYHIAADANNAKWSDWRRFPFGKDRQSLVAAIHGHELKGLTPSKAVIDAILDDIQPYEGGKLNIYGLHKLDITDKHIVLIPTQSEMRIDRLDFTDKSGAKTGGGISNITLVMPDQNEGGHFIDTGSGGAILNGEPKTVFEICFQKGQPYEGESILETAKTLHSTTIKALSLIKEAI